MLECKICKKKTSNKGLLVIHQRTCEKVFPHREEIKKLYSVDLWSIRNLCEKFQVGRGIISEILGDLIRSISEANVIAHKKYPDSFKHTDATKKQISIKRLEFIKNNPEKTAWRMGLV